MTNMTECNAFECKHMIDGKCNQHWVSLSIHRQCHKYEDRGK